MTQAVLSQGGDLLTRTEDVVGRWKEYFEDLLNPTNTPSVEEAEPEALGGSFVHILGGGHRGG